MAKDKVIADGVLKTAPVKWQELEFLQSANFKDLTPEGFDKLKTSILQNDFCETFKVWENGKKIYCLDGFHRCKALESLKADGYAIPEEFQASFIKCKNKKDAAKKVLIYSSVYAKMTDEGLYEFSHDWGLDWEEIKFEVDLPDFNIGKYEEGYIYDNEYDEEKDEVSEPPANPNAKPGDIYLLGGKHRLICGDALDPEDVALLMDGKKAHMVFTDPPYNIDYGAQKNNPRWKIRSIEGDKQTDDQWIQFNIALCAMLEQYTLGDVYIWGAQGPDGMRQRLTFIDNGLHWSATIIWQKHIFSLGSGKYHRQYEPCFYGWFGKSSFCGDRKQADVWEHDRPRRSDLHPTMKPVEVIKHGINLSSQSGEIVLDLFGGSGSTLIACADAGRICYMSELDPGYIDVIIKRYQDYTGEDVEKIKDGKK